MSTSGTKKKRRNSGIPPQAEVAIETRIDTAHSANTSPPQPVAAATEDLACLSLPDEPGDELPLDPPMELAQAAAESPLSAEQIRAQAAQLAEHLRARQRELDIREAALNARAAQLDHDARAARLWHAERMAEWEERVKAAGKNASEDRPTQEPAAEVLEARARQLDQSEQRLEAQRLEVQQLQQQWLRRRRELEDEAQAQSEQIAAERVRMLSELEEKRRTLEQRSEELDQSKAALEQLRTEMGRMQRETLEIRLATEELWAQISGAAPPASLVQSLGKIRSRLSDHYRLANAELQQKKEELEKLRQQLTLLHERLARQKRQWEQWLIGCREEIQQQAARLVLRGEELDRRQQETEEQSHRWQSERLDLQQEVRRLRTRLQSAETVGV